MDTNALSALVDGDTSVARVLGTSHRVTLPVVALGEFRYGIARSRHRRAYEAWLVAHLSDFEVLEVTTSTTPFYASIRLELRRLGKPIPANDAWIAALALEHDLPVVSRDVHFDNVPDVVRHDY